MYKGYLTAMDAFVIDLVNGKMQWDAEAIQTLITADETSDKKEKMRQGRDYYALKQKYDDFKFNQYWGGKKEDSGEQEEYINNAMSDEKSKNPHLWVQIEEKISFIAGKDPIIKAVDEKRQDDLKPLINRNFYKTMRKMIGGSSAKGLEFLHPMEDEKNQFNFLIFNSIQIIPIYDTEFMRFMVGFIRYYYLEQTVDRTGSKTLVVEFWSKNGIEVYRNDNEQGQLKFVQWKDHSNIELAEDENGNFYIKDEEAGNQDPFLWDELPIIKMENNSQEITDLEAIYDKINILDKLKGRFANDVIDIKKAFFVVKGHPKADMQKFMVNLNANSAAKVHQDGDIKPIIIEIPIEAVKEAITDLEGDIHKFGRSFDSKRIDKIGGSPSGTLLNILYTPLEEKCEPSMREYDEVAQELVNFYTTWKGIEPIEIKTEFNVTRVRNRKEEIENLNASSDVLTRKEKTEKNPYSDKNTFDDKTEELKEMEAKRNSDNNNQNINNDNEN